MRGYAIGLLEKGLEPILLGLTVSFHARPRVRTTNHGTNRNGDDVKQLMLHEVLYSRILQIAEVVSYCYFWGLIHSHPLVFQDLMETMILQQGSQVSKRLP